MGEQLSLNEWVCLAVLAEQPRHGFAVAKQLSPESDLGRILTVRRPLVYRAIDRLVVAGLVEALQTEPGQSGPTRTVQRVTAEGRAAVARWLQKPVGHVRDLRVEFLLKLRLLERRGLSPRRLVAGQRRALDDTLAGLTGRIGSTAPIHRPAGPETGLVDGDGTAPIDQVEGDVVNEVNEVEVEVNEVEVEVDVVDVWRAFNARAVSDFLDQLQADL